VRVQTRKNRTSYLSLLPCHHLPLPGDYPVSMNPQRPVLAKADRFTGTVLQR
jgi:hypothetical protein